MQAKEVQTVYTQQQKHWLRRQLVCWYIFLVKSGILRKFLAKTTSLFSSFDPGQPMNCFRLGQCFFSGKERDSRLPSTRQASEHLTSSQAASTPRTTTCQTLTATLCAAAVQRGLGLGAGRGGGDNGCYGMLYWENPDPDLASAEGGTVNSFLAPFMHWLVSL